MFVCVSLVFVCYKPNRNVQIKYRYVRVDQKNWIDTCFFYKHIKIQGLGSDMLKAPQNTGWKYAYYDMLILCVKILKMDAKSVGLSHIACTVIHKL